MKRIVTTVLGIVLLSGCASYSASPLTEAIHSSSTENKGIVLSATAFTRADCKRYLDRDVIQKGYQPVQLCIQNNSDQNYIFSLSRINLPYARSEEVADKVHTSTVGRAVGYGVGALFLWPLAIPAVIDGCKSADANVALDSDFSAKTARDQVISPYSRFNKLIFVPINEFQPTFNVTLIDQATNEPRTFNVTVQ